MLWLHKLNHEKKSKSAIAFYFLVNGTKRFGRCHHPKKTKGRISSPLTAHLEKMVGISMTLSWTSFNSMSRLKYSSLNSGLTASKSQTLFVRYTLGCSSTQYASGHQDNMKHFRFGESQHRPSFATVSSILGGATHIPKYIKPKKLKFYS